MEKALFEAWERQIAEMVGLETAFPCVPIHLNACLASCLLSIHVVT